MATYNGDNNNNVYNGTIDIDYIYGKGGNDTLYGEAGNDDIHGDDGNDKLYGGAGRDDLYGGLGADTYIITKIDEIDFISDTGGLDVIKFADVASTDIKITRSTYGTLLLYYGDNSELIVWNQFLHPDSRIDVFQFSDGVIWNWSDIELITKDDDTLHGIDGQRNTLFGFAGNDWLYGGNLGDTLNGGLGDDYLESYDGNDLLIGGRGNDILQGLSGSDTYLIGKNDGKDLIHNEWQESGSVNTVKFTDLNLTGLTAIGLADDKLVINYGNNSQLTLPTNVIDKFLFADGNTLTNFIIGTTDNNTLGGTVGNDAIAGLQGADKMSGGAGNDMLNGGKGADILNGGNGKDVLIGGWGKDKFVLTETTVATDTVKISGGDSNPNAYDRVTYFTLGNGKAATGVDRLDLDSTAIAANVAAADGVNVGIIKSHAINNGIISFDDADTYAAALILATSNLADVFNYLKGNVTNRETVAVNALGRTYVFQDGGIADTVVQLNGVTANNLDHSGLIADGIWLV